jgi:hypothetical protein
MLLSKKRPRAVAALLALQLLRGAGAQRGLRSQAAQDAAQRRVTLGATAGGNAHDVVTYGDEEVVQELLVDANCTPSTK